MRIDWRISVRNQTLIGLFTDPMIGRIDLHFFGFQLSFSTYIYRQIFKKK